MGRSVNKVILVGRVGAQPEDKMVGSTRIAKLRVATSYKKSSGEEKTEWHSVTVFNQNAEFAIKYINKGDLVSVEGRIEYSESSQGKWFTDIVGNVDLLASHEKTEKNPVVARASYNPETDEAYSKPINPHESINSRDDDLPF